MRNDVMFYGNLVAANVWFSVETPDAFSSIAGMLYLLLAIATLFFSFKGN